MDATSPLDAREQFQARLFFTLGLGREPFNLFCEHCGKHLGSDLPWVCGFCDGENRQTRWFSFLHKCQHCKQPPPCLACPHCRSIIFFGTGADARHAAKKIEPPRVPETAEEIRSRKQREREDERAEKEHELTIARLNAELVKLRKVIEKTLEAGQKKSPGEALEESFSQHDAHVMAAYKIAKREREANQKKYADDPELLEMANESVRDWLENQRL